MKTTYILYVTCKYLYDKHVDNKCLIKLFIQTGLSSYEARTQTQIGQ